MALVKCSECGKEVSSNAEACPNCGNPTRPKSSAGPTAGTYCPNCRTNVTPVVTSVGGGSCSFGKRETWKCPRCTRVLHRSGCFVATATYGDEDIAEVQFLRAFRHDGLSQSMFGRLVIWIYYHMGPYAARGVDMAPSLRPVCRRVLDEIVSLIEMRTNLRRETFRMQNDTKKPRP